MAKVKFGPLAGDVRKSLGSITYSKNRFGPYVRARTSPVQPRTALQLERRDFLVQLSTLYRNLTDAQREDWNNLGQQIVRTDSLGSTYNPTGLQMYVGVNLVRRSFGVARVDTAPVLGISPNLGTLVAVAQFDSGSGADVVTLDGTGQANRRVMIYAAGPRSAGRTFVTGIGPNGLIRGGEWRLLYAGATTAGGSGWLVDLSVAYKSRFGTLESKDGARVPLAAVPVDDSFLIYPPIRADAFVETV